MNELTEYQQPTMAIVPVAEIQQRVKAIKQLIQGVMVENIHFGVIPGTNKKKVLFKPGAEQICAMFRIASRYTTDDLSVGNTIRYRVTCQGVTPAGEILGEGLGEASTEEEKYRWRKMVCQEEFDATPETQRRVVYKHGSNGGHYKVQQIMTNAADSANTILKMAAKRAHVAMVLSVTGCSDDFSQDIVDEDDKGPPTTDDEAPPTKTPQRKTASQKAAQPTKAPAGEDLLGERRWIENKVKEVGADLAVLLADAGIESLNDLTPDSFRAIKQALTE